jgi:hypothetical protein
MIERIDEINYAVEVQGQLPWVGLQKELIERINTQSSQSIQFRAKLIDIVLRMKVGDKTKKPEAFYGDIPSVNGVPKR